MENSSYKTTGKAPACPHVAREAGTFFQTPAIALLAILWVLALLLPCQGGQGNGAPTPPKTSAPDSIPQWSWSWVDDLRETGKALIPVPVTLNPQSSFQSNSKLNATYSLSQDGVENSGRQSLFSMLDDGEALLDLLDRSGRENSPGFEGMLSDTLNTSFLSLGSRLEFHVSKRFLPYLGGGVIYGGRDSSNTVSANLPKTSGYELGVGFTFSDAPVRFGVDLLYRGMDLNEEDPCISMRKDETCPNSFDKDGYSMSMGFTFHF